MIPPGKRGFLFAKSRLRGTAQAEDRAPPRQDQGGTPGRAARPSPRTPSCSASCRRTAPRCARSCSSSTRPRRHDFRDKLQSELGSKETDVGKLLSAFFQTDDDNFARPLQVLLRRARAVAGAVPRARRRHADHQGVHRRGYVQSVNVPVYGTFQFKGLEKSPLAGALNLMDLVSFRELYGFLTAREAWPRSRQLKAAAGAHEVNRENAEAELFGSKPAAAPATPAERAPSHRSDRDPGRRPGDARSRRVGGRQAAARRGAQPRLSRPARSRPASC